MILLTSLGVCDSLTGRLASIRSDWKRGKKEIENRSKVEWNTQEGLDSHIPCCWCWLRGLRRCGPFHFHAWQDGKRKRAECG